MTKMNSLKIDSVNNDTNQQKPTAMKLLMAGAMALPAYAEAADMPMQNEFSYRYSNYAEDQADESKIISGDSERFEIQVHQFRLLKLLDDESTLTVTALTESLSGASPWATQVGANGQADLIMSGASISESRQDLGVKYTSYSDTYSTSFHGGFSQENDYRSFYWGGSIDKSFNLKNTVVSFGATMADDVLTPSDAAEFGRIERDSKQTYTLFGSISQILTPNSVGSFSFSTTRNYGFLSDPYKLGDARPDKRISDVYAFKYRYFWSGADAAIHVNYRFYQDDWDLDSDTFEIEWHQNIRESVQLIPSFRFYSQSETWFYEPYAAPGSTEQYFSSDYRLSPYGAVSGKLKLIHNLDSWSYTFSYERYQSDAEAGLDNVEIDNPALVSFNRLTLGFDYKF